MHLEQTSVVKLAKNARTQRIFIVEIFRSCHSIFCVPH